MKRILVACGNGIATSTMVVSKIKNAMEEAGIPVEIGQSKLMEIPSKASQYDVVVTTGKYENDSVDTPIINAISLLTGINQEETIAKIVELLK